MNAQQILLDLHCVGVLAAVSHKRGCHVTTAVLSCRSRHAPTCRCLPLKYIRTRHLQNNVQRYAFGQKLVTSSKLKLMMTPLFRGETN